MLRKRSCPAVSQIYGANEKTHLLYMYVSTLSEVTTLSLIDELSSVKQHSSSRVHRLRMLGLKTLMTKLVLTVSNISRKHFFSTCLSTQNFRDFFIEPVKISETIVHSLIAQLHAYNKTTPNDLHSDRC